MIRLVHRGTVTLSGEAWYLSGIHPSAGPWHEMPSARGRGYCGGRSAPPGPGPGGSPYLEPSQEEASERGPNVLKPTCSEVHPEPADGLAVTLEPVDVPEALAGRWLDLERRSDGSFFQSWGWIGCWLRHLPSGLTPRLLTVSSGSEVVGLGVLVARRETRHGLLRVRGLHLNETGDRRIDPISIEYNGVLADRSFGNASVIRRSLTWLAANEDGWDELNLGGLNAETAEIWEKAAVDNGLGIRVQAKRRCDCIDFEAIRRSEVEYLGALSRNARHQVRRAMRLYEAAGPLRLQAAQTVEDALDMLGELKMLHQAYWTRRGHAGSFARGFFESFHHDLISKRFDAGEIQLLRISAGEKLIGCLYNFVKDGRVYAYQSGFDYDADRRLKPGLVSHCLAVRHNLAQGALIYDFMAGDSRYKRSLGTDSHALYWLVVQRPAVHLRFENALRAIKRKLSSRTKGP